MMTELRQKKKGRTTVPSLSLFIMSYVASVKSLSVSERRLRPWRLPYCRSKHAPRTYNWIQQCPCQEAGRRTTRTALVGDRDICICMSMKDVSGSELPEEITTLSNDVDGIHDDFTELGGPNLPQDSLKNDALDSSNSLPMISLDTIDLLTESATSNIAYFYLKNEIGLSEETMWKITHEAGTVLGMTADTLRYKVDLLRRNMDLSDQDIRVILERQPTVLQLSAEQNLEPTILFLVRALDMGKADLRSIVLEFPCVLCYSTQNLKSKLNFFSRLMGYSTVECRNLLIAEPKLLTAGVKTGLLPHLRFFTYDLDIPLDKLRAIIQKNPLLLLYSLEDNLVPKLIFYLTMNLRMDSEKLLRLLTKYPQFVDYNLNDHILPITAYLMQELEFSPTEVRQILLSFPRFVSCSLKKIKHVVGYLRFELGLGPAQVKRVLYQAPQVVGLNTDDTLKKKVSFLRETFQLTDDELRRVIAGMPTLLICSVESNLQPKTEYLRQIFNNTKDLRDAILTMPALLGYSLEKRIKPRMERLLEIGGHPRGITVGIPMKDEAFDKWLSGRQKRLDKSPEFDAKVKTPSGDEKVSIVHLSKKEDGDGRIVHWTRERRPPSQKPQ